MRVVVETEAPKYFGLVPNDLETIRTALSHMDVDKIFEQNYNDYDAGTWEETARQLEHQASVIKSVISRVERVKIYDD